MKLNLMVSCRMPAGISTVFENEDLFILIKLLLKYYRISHIQVYEFSIRVKRKKNVSK